MKKGGLTPRPFYGTKPAYIPDWLDLLSTTN